MPFRDRLEREPKRILYVGDKMNIERIAAMAAAECVRQGVTDIGRWELPEPGALVGLLRAYDYAWSHQHSLPTLDDILYIGTMIHPPNQRRLRIVPITFSNGALAPHYSLVPGLMHTLMGFQSTATPYEWVKEFLDIHPFEDGNGRTAWVLLNWLKIQLNHPEPLPYFYKEN